VKYERPIDYSYDKVVESLYAVYNVAFDGKSAPYPPNVIMDLLAVLAHIAVYPVPSDKVIYLKCAYEDLTIQGFIGVRNV
jgi:hypothetical protein